jgi:hypothetical protein
VPLKPPQSYPHLCPIPPTTFAFLPSSSCLPSFRPVAHTPLASPGLRRGPETDAAEQERKEDDAKGNTDLAACGQARTASIVVAAGGNGAILAPLIRICLEGRCAAHAQCGSGRGRRCSLLPFLKSK